MLSLDRIDIEDLQYIEKDLCFYELVSLSLLLYGEDKINSEYIVQKLVILAHNPPPETGKPFANTDILRNYTKLNSKNWRKNLVEALSIIKAKKVLRKLGLSWQDIDVELLPHVPELSTYVHPLLKVLYKICERMPPYQTQMLINFINERYPVSQNLPFNDSSYLEIFLLNWLAKGVICCGNKEELKGYNLDILIEYFKFNEMHALKDIIFLTINLKGQTGDKTENAEENEEIEFDSNETNDDEEYYGEEEEEISINIRTIDPEKVIFDDAERYKLTKENVGYILIINQNQFYYETNPELQHLLPERNLFKPTRDGTDIDRDTLKKVFSNYGYIPRVFNNLTHSEILQEIRNTVEKSKDKDSIIICILTHGMEGAVYGCNFIPVSISEIREILTNRILKGKPSMVILQACQKYDPKVDTTSTSAIKKFLPSKYADQIWAISAIRGTESMRNTCEGSWFIQCLCEAIQKYANSKHILEILTITIDIISRKNAGPEYFMLPEQNSTLRKELYLPTN